MLDVSVNKKMFNFQCTLINGQCSNDPFPRRSTLSPERGDLAASDAARRDKNSRTAIGRAYSETVGVTVTNGQTSSVETRCMASDH